MFQVTKGVACGELSCPGELKWAGWLKHMFLSILQSKARSPSILRYKTALQKRAESWGLASIVFVSPHWAPFAVKIHCSRLR